jgi:4-phytase / acid phosphatase
VQTIAVKAMRLACMCVLAWESCAAQETKSAVADDRGGGRLKMVVILSRHGVRSPTWTQARLDSYSARPWPKWSVPPGELTSRGYVLIEQFGSFDRASLAGAGLFSMHGCEDASKIYIWADTDQRTMASGKAFADGFFPGCPPQVHGLSAGENDPLFHSPAKRARAAESNAASPELAARSKQQTDPRQEELIEEMQHVLLGCAPKTVCKPAYPPETSLLSTPTSALRGKDDHIVDLQGPLAQASSFAEDFLLEYVDGMPMDQVGWGKR